jgi:hypothetical protein
MENDDDEFSDGLEDDFEQSMDDRNKRPQLRNQTTYQNKPYDEAVEVSQDLSMAESYDFRDKVCSCCWVLVNYLLFISSNYHMKEKEN